MKFLFKIIYCAIFIVEQFDHYKYCDLSINYINICIWLITDHRLAIEDKFAKLEPTDNKAIAPIKTWLIMLNDFAVFEFEISCWEDWVFCCGDGVFNKFQLPTLKLNPELQITQTEESVAEHIWQLLDVHFLTIRLINLWTGPDIPEILESM